MTAMYGKQIMLSDKFLVLCNFTDDTGKQSDFKSK